MTDRDTAETSLENVGSLILATRITAKAPAGGNKAEVKLPIGVYDRTVVVFASAHGSAAYKGSATNSGILVKITEGTRVVAQDDTFENQSSNITYRASTSHTFALSKGFTTQIIATVEPYGSGSAGNKNARIEMSIIVLAVD